MKRRSILLGLLGLPVLVACGPKAAEYDLNSSPNPLGLPEEPTVEDIMPECNDIVRPPPPYAPQWDLVEERRFEMGEKTTMGARLNCKSFRYVAKNRDTGVSVDLTPFGNSIHAAWKAGALG